METNRRNLIFDALDIGILHKFFEHLHQKQLIETIKLIAVFHKFIILNFGSILDFRHYLIVSWDGFSFTSIHQSVHFNFHLSRQNARLDKFDNLLFLNCINGFLRSHFRNLFILNSFIIDGILIQLFIVFHFTKFLDKSGHETRLSLYN